MTPVKIDNFKLMNRLGRRCPRLARVLTALESIAPLKYAEGGWDNVGLLYEHPFPHTHPSFNIMLALDLTEDVIKQAKSKECSMIVAYHPPWFKAVKRITQDAGSEARLIGICAALGISVFSPHTAVDNVKPGVNDWVAEQVFKEGKVEVQVMAPSALYEDVGAGRIVTLNSPMPLNQVLESVSLAFNMPTSTQIAL